MNEKLVHIRGIAASIFIVAAFLLAVSVANAFFADEDLGSKKVRLEEDYTNQTQIIMRAEEVIEKQYDIRDRAEQTLRSLTIGLANTKAQIELESETPNMEEIYRLNTIAADNARSLTEASGLSRWLPEEYDLWKSFQCHNLEGCREKLKKMKEGKE